MKKKDEDKGISFFSFKVLLPTMILTGSAIGSFYIYRLYFRRIPISRKIPESFYRKRSMLGRVISVGDGDNFHFYHTPGGIFAGWGWLRHAPPVNARKMNGHTIHVRLNGVDAPEGAHFGRPAQKWCDEALQWLRSYILGRKVRIKPLAMDQYQRTVAEAIIWTWTGSRNVSAEMLKNGWGVVYEAKTGAEFNGKEEWFRKLEAVSRKKKIGMFQDGEKLVTPGQYKKQYK